MAGETIGELFDRLPDDRWVEVCGVQVKRPGGQGGQMRHWWDIEPADAVDLDLSVRLDIIAPLNEDGERCPWPWDPQQSKGAPIGQYHCPYCGAMVLAGLPHLDYAESCQRCMHDTAAHGYQDEVMTCQLCLDGICKGVQDGPRVGAV